MPELILAEAGRPVILPAPVSVIYRRVHGDGRRRLIADERGREIGCPGVIEQNVVAEIKFIRDDVVAPAYGCAGIPEIVATIAGPLKQVAGGREAFTMMAIWPADW